MLSVSLTSLHGLILSREVSIASSILLFDFSKVVASAQDLLSLLFLMRDRLVFLAVRSEGRKISSSCESYVANGEGDFRSIFLVKGEAEVKFGGCLFLDESLIYGLGGLRGVS